MIPYVCYADFESIIKTAPSGEQEHVLISFCIKLIGPTTNKKLEMKPYLGEDCMEKFFKKLSEIREFVLVGPKKTL